MFWLCKRNLKIKRERLIFYPINQHLHWRWFKAKLPVTATNDNHYYTCLGHLGQCDAIEMILIDKESKEYAISCHDIAEIFANNL